MKKFLIIISALVLFTPHFVFADAGGAGQGVIDNGEYVGCQKFSCKCSLNGEFKEETFASHSAAECEALCVNIVKDYNGGFTDPENTTGAFTCAVLPTTTTTKPKRDPILPCLNVPIPGLSFGNCGDSGVDPEADTNLVTTADGETQSNILGEYVRASYQYLIGASAIVAATMLMIAGIQYATARGDAKQVDTAKKRIGNAVVGIILLLLAYNIAFLLNPATTTFDALSLKHIDPVLYVNNSGDYPAPLDFTSIVPPSGVICDQSSSVYDVAKSLEGKVTYRLGGKGGPAPYPYDTKTDPSGVKYATYCPEGQLCLDCSGYAAYVAHCAGLTPVGESGGTRGIFSGAERVSQCTNDTINGTLLEPGDLIGWSSVGSGYGHVFVYVGQGKISDSAGSGRGAGRAVSMKDTTWACNSYMNTDHGLFVVRRP